MGAVVCIATVFAITHNALRTDIKDGLLKSNIEALTNDEGYTWTDGQWIGRCCPPFESTCWTSSVGTPLTGIIYPIVMYCK